MFTLRQFRPHQKAELLAAYPVECRSAADLLGDDLKSMRFTFASVSQHRDESKSVQIEFEGAGRVVWIKAKGTDAQIVLDGTAILC